MINALLWPLAAVIQPLITPSMRFRGVRLIASAGLERVLGVAQLLAAQVFCAFALAAIPWAAGGAAHGVKGLSALMFLFGGWLPRIWLLDLSTNRRRRIQRELPFLIDLVAMSIESGLAPIAALGQSIERLATGPLRDECRRALRDLKTGRARQESFRALTERSESSALGAFVAALTSAQLDGGGVVRVLRAQAEQQRAERLSRAERQAMQAPVRMLFPLVVFIFPGTFAVLLYPVISRLLGEVSR